MSTTATSTKSNKIIKQFQPVPGLQVGFAFDKERAAKAAALLVYNVVLFLLTQVELAAKSAIAFGRATRPVVNAWVARQLESATNKTQVTVDAAAKVVVSSASKLYTRLVDLTEQGVQAAFNYFSSVTSDIKVSLQGVRKV